MDSNQKHYPIDDFPNLELPEPINQKVKDKAFAPVGKTDIQIVHPDLDNAINAIRTNSFYEGGQYGYNLAQVFTNDLKTLIREHEEKYRELLRKYGLAKGLMTSEQIEKLLKIIE